MSFLSDIDTDTYRFCTVFTSDTGSSMTGFFSSDIQNYWNAAKFSNGFRMPLAQESRSSRGPEAKP